jgi:hypothetical protein
MALPRTGLTQQTSATAEAGQEHNPTWRIEMALGGILSNRSWVDVTNLVRRFSFTRGRADELQDFSTCSLSIIFDNREGFFTPEYSPLVTPGRPMRVMCEAQGKRYMLCFGYVDEWAVEYPTNGRDGVATASCNGVFTLLQSVRSDTFLDPQITTDRIIQMAAEAGAIELDIDTGSIAMPEFELYETEVGAVIKAAASTEFGQLYENKSGGLRFDGRGRRFTQTATKIIFGDDLAIEAGYEDAEWDYSQNKIFNRVTITADPDDPQTLLNPTSAAIYGVKQFSADIDAINGVDDDAFNTTYAESLASFILGRYSEPALRVNSIGLVPAGDDSIWDALLGLEINDRVVVNRRPPGYTPELTTSPTRKTQFGTENLLLEDPTADPYGTNLSRRTVTNGLITSDRWTVGLADITNGSGPEYEIITEDSGFTYFQTRLFANSYTPDGSLTGRISTFHEQFSSVPSKYYVFSAYVYGASVTTVAGEETDRTFNAHIGITETLSSGPGGGSQGISGNIIASSLSGFSVNNIEPQRIWAVFLTDSDSAFLSPSVVLEIGRSAIPNGSVIELRFGLLAVLGPFNSPLGFNGLTISNFSGGYAYGTLDPAYTSPNNDIYDLMNITTPSIGTRIERECFVEQIRYDVSPGNDKWKVALGLSDAITGAYWALGKSKLGIDTRLAI